MARPSSDCVALENLRETALASSSANPYYYSNSQEVVKFTTFPRVEQSFLSFT